MEGRKAVSVLACVLAAAMIAATGTRVAFPERVEIEGAATGSATSNAKWWFDTTRKTVCWEGRSPSPSQWDFVVDLDGNHMTGVTSLYGWANGTGNYTQLWYWVGRQGGSPVRAEVGAGFSLSAESIVRPPVWWILVQTTPVWYHVFVTKRDAPTNWVFGVSSADGYRDLPITQPFWVSLDAGWTWTRYDPANYTGPTGDCLEDYGPRVVKWWFDPGGGTLCWNGWRHVWQLPWYVIFDLDGVHETGMSSIYGWWGGVGNYTAHYTWESSPEGFGGRMIWNESGDPVSLISSTAVWPPWPHYQFDVSVGGTPRSEWFHLFVTKRTAPTDWVLGLSADDGHRALPITNPFWVSLDMAYTWTMYDPASYAGPTGVCKEDLPPAQTLNASIDFDPDTLNPRSQGKWVTVYIELPQGYDPRDINATTIRLNDTLAPVLDPKYGFVTDPGGYITDHDRDGIEERMVKFDRAAVIGLLSPGTYPVRITGALVSGTPFEGLSEPIRVLNPSR